MKKLLIVSLIIGLAVCQAQIKTNKLEEIPMTLVDPTPSFLAKPIEMKSKPMTDTVNVAQEFEPIFAASNLPVVDPKQIQIENRVRQVNEKIDNKIAEAQSHLSKKIHEIENDSEYDVQTKSHKKQKANRKFAEHVEHLEEKRRQKIEEIYEEAQEDEEDEQTDLAEGNETDEHKKQRRHNRNNQRKQNNKHKKWGKRVIKILIGLAVFGLVLAFVIRRVKRRRERKMKWRQMQQQQPVTQQPNHMIAQPVDMAPVIYNGSVPNYTENSTRPVNPQYRYEVEMNSIPASSRKDEDQIPPKEEEFKGTNQNFQNINNGQVQYVPVRIMPNGQMVLLTNPPAYQSQPQQQVNHNVHHQQRQNKYPDLENVITGAPIQHHFQNYNYPIKSQD